MVHVSKSIQRKKLIYTHSSWYGVLTLIYPIFILVVALAFSYWGLEKELTKESYAINWVLISIFSAVIVFAALLVLAYFRSDRLAIIKGSTRSLNRKLVRQYIENDRFEVLSVSNELITVDVKAKFLSYHDVRRFTILFDKEHIYYNCTTFSYIQNRHIQLYDFKSPFAWFANRRVEQEFKEYMKRNL